MAVARTAPAHRMRLVTLLSVASSLALFAPPTPAAIARAPLRLAAPARPAPLLTRASPARMAAAAQLAFGLRPYLRWVESKRNMADGPSRGYPIGVAPEWVAQEEMEALRRQLRRPRLPSG